MIDELVKREIDKKIKDTFVGKETLLNLFLKHPTKEALYCKVVSELRRAEIRYPSLLNHEVIKSVAHTFAIEYCRQVLHTTEKAIQSEAEKLMKDKQLAKYNEMMEGVRNADASEHRDFGET